MSKSANGSTVNVAPNDPPTPKRHGKHFTTTLATRQRAHPRHIKGGYGAQGCKLVAVRATNQR